MNFELVWFDSFGAKSSCLLVKTDVNIIVDPGIAIMHPSFPASKARKVYWREKGKEEIVKACKKADIVIISHYHHDHYIRDDLNLYKNKTLFIKNPNEYINESQRSRAEKFFLQLSKKFGIEMNKISKKKKKYADPLLDLKSALSKEYGEYKKRKEELIEKGIKWFEKRAEKWNEYEQIPEVKEKDIEIRFPEGKSFKFKNTKIRFTKPLFHGIEFSKVGWIFSTVIEYGGEKLIHTSDINGPIIEDYAEWIIKEKPTLLILDGPPTYMLGYMLNKINLSRAIENAVRIIDEASPKLIIYDHHLPRERKFREHTIKVWESAKKKGVKLMTASEYMGKKPVVEAG